MPRRNEQMPGPVTIFLCDRFFLWGSNWDFSISREQKNFAHRLIDEAGVDVIYGHSSHHIKGIEVYKEKLIIYGCGDLLNTMTGNHEDEPGQLQNLRLL